MNEDRLAILRMLQESKITVDEAARLIEALERATSSEPRVQRPAKGGRTVHVEEDPVSESEPVLVAIVDEEAADDEPAANGDAFAGADITGTSFGNALLEGANFRNADLMGAVLDGADLRNANFQGVDMVGAVLIGANFRNSNLKGADLTGAVLEHANFQDANLPEASLTGAVLPHANFQGVTQRGLDLTGTVKTGFTYRPR